MSGKRLYNPSVSINAVEYKCLIRSVSLEPGDWINFCEEEWTFQAEIELGYGTGESFTLLEAIANTVVTVILFPEDAVVGATNPSATFSMRMPSPAFMTAASRGDRQTFSLEGTTEAVPVFAFA